ncbi:MAG: GNAT family N-acetyltransferase [Chloroflexota bacterium]
MIEIRRIEPDEWMTAKRLIYRVAHEIFHETRPLEEAIADFESRGELSDMDDIQANYFENGGIFLVMTDRGEIICTGAIRRYAEGICELKRLWLLQEHQGKRLGYQMIQALLAFARGAGYRHIRLETHPAYQKRAVEFYKKLGFTEIPIPNPNDDEDILMEMEL